MQFIKFVIGVLALLFAIAHIIGLAAMLSNGSLHSANAFVAGSIGGRVFGICLGAAIALACFRQKKQG